MPTYLVVVMELILIMVVVLFNNIQNNIIINEIHYNPSTSLSNGFETESDEFIEIYNRGESTLNLTGVGVTLNNTTPRTYVFGDVDIDAGGFVVLAKTINDYICVESDFTDDLGVEREFPFHGCENIGDIIPKFNGVNGMVWGENLFNWRGGTLNNTTPFTIEIKNPIQVINNDSGYGRVDYNQGEENGWPEYLSGGSLELVDSTIEGVDLYAGSNWKASKVVGGTPGLPNTGGVDVIISEIQFNVPSISDGWGDEFYEFVELYNTTEVDIDLSEWDLSSGGDDLYTFPVGTRILADNFVVVARTMSTYNPLVEENADNETNRVEIDHLVAYDGDNASSANLFGDWNIDAFSGQQENINDSSGETISLFKPGTTTRFYVDQVRLRADGAGANPPIVSPFGEEFEIPFDLNSTNQTSPNHPDNLNFSLELIFPEDRSVWTNYNNYDATNWRLSQQWGGSPGKKRNLIEENQCTVEGACNEWVWNDNPLDINYWPVPYDDSECILNETTYCECEDILADNSVFDTECQCCSSDTGANSCTGCNDSDANNTYSGCVDCEGVQADASNPCTLTDNAQCTYEPQNVASFTVTHSAALNSNADSDGDADTPEIDDEQVNVTLNWTYTADPKYPYLVFKFILVICF